MCQNVWCSTSKPLLQRNLALQHWSKCPVWSQTLFPASQTRYFFVAPLLPYRRSSAECSVLIDLLVKWNSLEHTEHMHQWWRSRICCRCGLINSYGGFDTPTAPGAPQRSKPPTFQSHLPRRHGEYLMLCCPPLRQYHQEHRVKWLWTGGKVGCEQVSEVIEHLPSQMTLNPVHNTSQTASWRTPCSSFSIHTYKLSDETFSSIAVGDGANCAPVKVNGNLTINSRLVIFHFLVSRWRIVPS